MDEIYDNKFHPVILDGKSNGIKTILSTILLILLTCQIANKNLIDIFKKIKARQSSHLLISSLLSFENTTTVSSLFKKKKHIATPYKSDHHNLLMPMQHLSNSVIFPLLVSFLVKLHHQASKLTHLCFKLIY